MIRIPTWAASALWLTTVMAAVGVFYWPGAEGLAQSAVANLLIAAALLGTSALLSMLKWRRRRALRLAVSPRTGRSDGQA